MFSFFVDRVKIGISASLRIERMPFSQFCSRIGFSPAPLELSPRVAALLELSTEVAAPLRASSVLPSGASILPSGASTCGFSTGVAAAPSEHRSASIVLPPGALIVLPSGAATFQLDVRESSKTGSSEVGEAAAEEELSVLSV